MIHLLLALLTFEFASKHSGIDGAVLDNVVAITRHLLAIVVDGGHLSLALFILHREVLRVRVVCRAVPQDWRTHAQTLFLSLHPLDLFPLIIHLLLIRSSVAATAVVLRVRRVYLLIIYILKLLGDSTRRSFFEIWL